MSTRITKVDEFQFLTCVKYKVWGATTNRFKSWKIGDILIFIIDKHFVALAKVIGESYKSSEKVWDNGDYPYRIDINFIYILSKENRLPILGELRDALINAWGTSYGWGILNQKALPPEAETQIINAFNNQTNDLKHYYSNLDMLLIDAKEERDKKEAEEKNSEPKKRGRKKKDESIINTTSNEPLNYNAKHTENDNIDNNITDNQEIEEGSIHTKSQHMLIKMGKITGCSVWVASNDYNKTYQGEILGKDCIDKLPNFGLSKEAMDRITYIDTIWIQQNAPICAFEVETTTSIYSGLLRMADLIALVPALKIKLFIVAPNERKKKVMQELNRPIFKKIGLNDYCRFISIEDLEIKIEQIKDLYGDVKPTIIEKIAIEADIYDY